MESKKWLKNVKNTKFFLIQIHSHFSIKFSQMDSGFQKIFGFSNQVNL